MRMVNLNILSNLRRVGERPLFGIYAGVGIGILASVYIAMMPHDVRPLLCIPWLCLILIAWEAARIFAHSRSKSALWAVISAVCFGLPTYWVYLALAPAPEPPPAPTFGWLQPANEPTPPNTCEGARREPKSVLLVIGTDGFLHNQPESFGVLQLENCHMINIHVTPNGAQIDAILNDNDGAPLGEILRNKFVMRSVENHLTVERTGDLSTLIVHNSADEEVLWVKYLNPTTFRIRGKFTCAWPRLETVVITDEGVAGLPASNSCLVDSVNADLFIRSSKMR